MIFELLSMNFYFERREFSCEFFVDCHTSRSALARNDRFLALLAFLKMVWLFVIVDCFGVFHASQ